MSAPQAVRRGNERLIGGQPDEALEAYRYAEQLEPDAREIAFVEGLAHYDLKEFDEAREAFRKAAAGDDDLADDAVYSLGATDHRESLESLEGNPQLALSLLESAMRRYRDVLARRPDHTAARDANFKAASIRRQLKKQLEQQRQKQKDDQRDQDDQQDEQQQQQEQQEDGEEQQEGRQSEPRDQDQEQEQQRERPGEDDKDKDRERQQPSQAEKQEQVSREQARRRLREMMQAIRDRKKSRRQPAQKVPMAPVDKDW